MKPIARNIRVYSGAIHANVDQLQELLGAAEFVECGASQFVSSGFVPVHDTRPEMLVTDFDGGWIAQFRRDTKSVPAGELKKAVEAKVNEVKMQYGRTPGRLERKDLKAEATLELLPRAFPRSSLAYVIYSTAEKRIYVATASQKVADAVMSMLVQCLSSLKTSAVHVSEPKMGLTTRLINWLDGGDEQDTFGELEPRGELVMASTGGQKWSVKSETLRSAADTIREAVRQGATVDSIGLMTETETKFRIDSALRINGVKHDVKPEADDKEPFYAFIAQVMLEMKTLNGIVDEMLELLSPEKAQTATSDNLFD